MNDDVKNLLYFPGNFKSESKPQGISFDDLPLWIRKDLYELQSAWGTPSNVFVREMAEDFLAAHWDLKTNKPRKTRWEKEDKKKPRSYSGRRLKPNHKEEPA